MATAGTTALTTAPVTLFDSSTSPDNAMGQCQEMYLQSDAASAGKALINVAGLHATGDFLPLPAGQRVYVRNGLNAVGKVTAKSDSTATLYWGVSARV